jgi:hypothetical protein
MLIEANKNDLDIANTIYTLTNNNYELVSHSHSAKKDFSQKEESNTSYDDLSDNFDFIFFSSEISDDKITEQSSQSVCDKESNSDKNKININLSNCETQNKTVINNNNSPNQQINMINQNQNKTIHNEIE